MCPRPLGLFISLRSLSLVLALRDSSRAAREQKDSTPKQSTQEQGQRQLRAASCPKSAGLTSSLERLRVMLCPLLLNAREQSTKKQLFFKPLKLRSREDFLLWKRTLNPTCGSGHPLCSGTGRGGTNK